MLPLHEKVGTDSDVLDGPVIALQDGLKEDWVAYESNGASPYWKVSENEMIYHQSFKITLASSI